MSLAKIRLFVDAPLHEGARLELDAQRSHYLLAVMRRRTGDAVAVFNGRDGEWQGEVVAASRKEGCVIELEACLRAQGPEPGPALLFAPLKRGPMEVLIEKATELGASRLEPVRMRRSVVTAVNEERVMAIAIEAAEQCRRLTLPELAPLRRLERVLEARPGDAVLYVADETGERPPALEALSEHGPGDVLIGPEGGFAPEELETLRAHGAVRMIDLGPRVLRAETAAMAALALWQARFAGE